MQAVRLRQCSSGALPVTQLYVAFCGGERSRNALLLRVCDTNKKSVKGVTFMNFCTPVGPCNHSHGQAYDELGHLLGSYVARVLIVLGLPVSIRYRNRMKS